jgi:sterol desaturase/sphingolipid hydroxylase (fatty acid hydroxylase superfamily)
MRFVQLAISSGVSFLFLVAVFRPLELAFPARPGQRFFRRAWAVDLCFFLGQYLLWTGVVFWMLMYVATWTGRLMPAGFRLFVASQPWWVQAIEVILLSDLFVYWGHRLQHRIGFLWRFHSIHHSAEHLDWLAAHREHPLDSIYTIGLINLPAFILGFPLQTIIGFIAFRGIWAIYIHSNVRLPIGPLRPLLGSPELHHWHHDRDRDAGNYANLSPIMDLLFGTYRCPAHEPESFGLHEPIPRGYLAQLLWPLLPSTKRAWLLRAPASRGASQLGSGEPESADAAASRDAEADTDPPVQDQTPEVISSAAADEWR